MKPSNSLAAATKSSIVTMETTNTAEIITPEPINFSTASNSTEPPSLRSNDAGAVVDDSTSTSRSNWKGMTRTIAHYERLEQIGLGTYGQVYRAICKDTGRIVAMKKMRNNLTTTTTTTNNNNKNKDNSSNNKNNGKKQSSISNVVVSSYQPTGMPLQLIREIKILKKLQHNNLLSMIEVVTSKGVEHLDIDDPIPVSSSNNNQRHQGEMISSSKKKRGTGSGKEDDDDETTDKLGENDVIENDNDNTDDQLQQDSTNNMLERERYKGNLFLVLEYMTHDLTGLLDVAYEFTVVQVKCIMKQLLSALQYMHEHKYIHRDIKSSNILLDSYFHLKLADFGLARSLEPPLLEQVESYSSGTSSTHAGNTSQDLTNKVITLWYRPPEILLGTVHYGCAVDVWSAGCILAELITGKPLATGKTEFEQLKLIADLTGTPKKNSDTWEYLFALKKSRSTPSYIIDTAMEWSEDEPRVSKLREKYGPNSSKNRPIPESALTLLEKVLEWDPRKRITASNALQHRYFWSQPVAPDNPAELGRIDVAEDGHFHEFVTKQKRKQAKQLAEQSREKAIKGGATTTIANERYDETYLGIMKQVAQEGFKNDSTTVAEEKVVPESASSATRPEKASANEPNDDKRRSSNRDRKHSRGGDSMEGVGTDGDDDEDDPDVSPNYSETRRRRPKKRRSSSDKNGDERASSRSHHHDRRRHSDESEYRSDKTKRRSHKESFDAAALAVATVKDSTYNERDLSNRSQESEQRDKEKKSSRKHSRRESDSGGRHRKDRNSRKSARDSGKKSNDIIADTNERRSRDDVRHHRRAFDRDNERDEKDRYRRPPENAASTQSPPMARNEFGRQYDYGPSSRVVGDSGGHRRPGYGEPPPRSVGGGGGLGVGGIYGDYRAKDRQENTTGVAGPVYGDYRPSDRRGGNGSHHHDPPPPLRNRERDGPPGNHFNVPPGREFGDRYGPPPPQRRDVGPGPYQHGPGRGGDFGSRDRPLHDDYPRREKDGPRGEYGGAPPPPSTARRDGPIYGSDPLYRRDGGARRPDSHDSRHSRDRNR